MYNLYYFSNTNEMARLENELERIKINTNNEIKSLNEKLESEKALNNKLKQELSAFDSV